jgi:hypothetical protein
VPSTPAQKPILFLDVDGVISLFGFPSGGPLPGQFHWVDGIAHCISDGAGACLRRLAEAFELVWATGWEETANDYLPLLLELPGELPVLNFDGRVAAGAAHWKTAAMAEYAGARPFAWIDDRIDATCREWARRHPAPTLLVETASEQGMVEEHVEELLEWARSLREDHQP